MAPSEQPPPPRPVFFPVVIAAVFLTIIGVSVGLVFKARAEERQQATNQAVSPPPPPSVAATTTSPTPEPDPSRPGPRPSRPAPAGATPTGSPLPCRAETQRQAAAAGSVGRLRRALQIQTATSSVWICADAEGRLFYHGNRGGPDDPWVEGETALFLTDVERHGDGYRARNTGQQGSITTFVVTREELLVEHPDGRIERQPAIED